MNSVYIVAAKRSPIGKFQGAFKSMQAPEIASQVLKSILIDQPVLKDHVDEVILGQVLTAGTGQAPARQTLRLGGLPDKVRALTIGKVCGSGLQSVILGTQSILLGDNQLVIAGGQESMSAAPYLLPQARDGLRMGHKEVVDSMIKDGLWDPYHNLHMGACAESCQQELAISREEQDEFCFESYMKAQSAINQGVFNHEIIPILAPAGKSTNKVEQDEEPFALGEVKLEKIKGLKGAFDKNGTITAANASKINDGAALIGLASEKAIAAFGLKPMAKIISYATFAQEPKWFTTAPVGAMQKALQKANLTVNDIDLFEINEAFALVTLAAMKELSIPKNKVNIHGGACALGHPIGASGARILTTLLYSLQSSGKKRGLASLCIGGGEGIACIVENMM